MTNVTVKKNTTVHGTVEMTATGLFVWRNEINAMNKRMGELRDSLGQVNGAWARVYTGQARTASMGVKNNYTVLQAGYDRQVRDGLFVGAALSYTDGSSTFAAGSGDNSLVALTGYASWVAENGAFVDATAKIGRITNETEGSATAKYHTNAVSFSLEAGHRFALPYPRFFVEPQAEFMYGVVRAVRYTMSNGVGVDQKQMQIAIVRGGAVLGMQLPQSRGNAYVRASLLHDYEADVGYAFSEGTNERAVNRTLGGTWYEFGAGANFSFAKNWHGYADAEMSAGGKVKTDYRLNAGVRCAW